MEFAMDQKFLEVGYGISQGDDSFVVGADATRKAISGIEQNPLTALLVFTSVRYDLRRLLSGIHDVAGEVPVIGTTTAGEICNGLYRGSALVVALASPYLTVKAGVGRGVSSRGWEEAVMELVSDPALSPFFSPNSPIWQELGLQGKDVFALLFSPGNTRHADTRSYEILEKLRELSSNMFPIFGGSSADDWHMEENYVILGHEVYPDSILLAIFETGLRFGISIVHGFRPIPCYATISSVRGHELLELDGKPAAEVFSGMLGMRIEDLKGKHISLTTGRPIGILGPHGQCRTAVASYFTEEGGIRLSYPLEPGTSFALVEASLEDLIEAGRDAFWKATTRGKITKPAVVLLFSCALRDRILGDRAEEEIRSIMEIALGAPVLGFKSFGEQGIADDGSNCYNNWALSVLVLGDELLYSFQAALKSARLQEDLRRHVSGLQAINSFTEKILKGCPLRESIPEILEKLATIIDVDRVYILERHIDENGIPLLSLRYEYDAPGVEPLMKSPRLQNLKYRDEVPAYWEKLMMEGDAIYGRIRDFSEDVRDLLAIGGTKSIALAAIRVGDEPWGVLGLEDCKSEREWLEVEIDILKAFANVLGTAIAREQAEEKMRERIEQALKHRSVLLELCRMDISDPDSAIRRILEIDARTLMVERVSIWQFSEDRTELICRDLFRMSENRHEEGMRLGVDRYPTYFRTLEESLTVAADDAMEDSRTREFKEDYLKPFGITSMMDVPIRIEGKVWGVICHEHVGPKRSWNLEEQEFGVLISELISMIIETRERRLAEARYREIFENAIEGIYQSTPEGRFINANPALARMLGYESPEELISSITDIRTQLYVDPDRRDQFIRLMEERGFVQSFEFRAYRKDGSIIWLSVNSRAVRDKDGRIQYFEGMMEDITERKRLWEQFLQAQKMEVLGRFAGGILHDLRNLLTIIFTNVDLLMLGLDPQSSTYEKLLSIKKAAESSAALSRKLLAFSRRQEAHPVKLNLNELIKGIERIVVDIIGEDIRCVLELAEELKPVEVDHGLMEQAVMNIIVNAREAMPRGGTLTIETRNVYLDEEYCRSHLDITPGEYVMLSISDTGVGMNPDVMEHIFEPFFTTKPDGTGLGLSTTYGIIKQFGGHIFVYSEVGKGTTFKIYLPPKEEPKEAKRPGYEGRAEMPKGRETILLVEDQREILALLSQVLQDLGYTVIGAMDVKEGIAKAYEHEGTIDLLLTDLVLPDGLGSDLALKLLERYKGMKVLFISGYTENHSFINSISGELEVRKELHFISKPFSTSDLARKIREVLEG